MEKIQDFSPKRQCLEIVRHYPRDGKPVKEAPASEKDYQEYAQGVSWHYIPDEYYNRGNTVKKTPVSYGLQHAQGDAYKI